MAEEDRYARQIDLPEIGKTGQRRLGKASVLVAGCGALGTNAAELLARAGIGRLRLVDFDRLERSNLQRQSLVRESDVGKAKEQVTAEALRAINAEIAVEPQAARVTPETVERLIAGVDLVMDGFDNLPTRYLLNDACVKHGIPWVFTAVAGTFGMTMPILPGDGPCLRCIMPEPAPDEVVLTAGTAGLINTIPRAVTAIAVTHALQILLGSFTPPVRLHTLDIWQGSLSAQDVIRNPDCPCCGKGLYEFLSSAR